MKQKKFSHIVFLLLYSFNPRQNGLVDANTKKYTIRIFNLKPGTKYRYRIASKEILRFNPDVSEKHLLLTIKNIDGKIVDTVIITAQLEGR